MTRVMFPMEERRRIGRFVLTRKVKSAFYTRIRPIQIEISVIHACPQCFNFLTKLDQLFGRANVTIFSQSKLLECLLFSAYALTAVDIQRDWFYGKTERLDGIHR